jgi:STAS domain
MNFRSLRRLLSNMERCRCDVGALPADAVAVDALARLQLAARRAGVELRLCHASPELCALLAFTGLDLVLRLEPEREPEEREERLGVEEEGQLPDPPA